MKYAHTDENGKLLEWVSDSFIVTAPNMKIAVNEDVWLATIDNGNNKVNIDGATEKFDYRTPDEVIADIENNKPRVVTIRQFRLALLESGLLTTVTDAISAGTNETLKIEWEYATEVNRNWDSLIALATSLGKTSADIDALFQLASTK